MGGLCEIKKDGYTYKITPQAQDYHSSQRVCRKYYGGQLVSQNLGKAGRYYHDKIRKIVDSNPDKAFWIGLTDQQTEGRWLFDSNEVNINEMIFKWKAGQPNNHRGNEDCVHTWGYYELNDAPCSNINEAWGKPIHGLCEIKKDGYYTYVITRGHYDYHSSQRVCRYYYG